MFKKTVTNESLLSHEQTMFIQVTHRKPNKCTRLSLGTFDFLKSILLACPISLSVFVLAFITYSSVKIFGTFRGFRNTFISNINKLKIKWPRRWCSRLKCSPRMRKVGCSYPSRDTPFFVFVCLGFFVSIENFHSNGYVTIDGEGLQILTCA